MYLFSHRFSLGVNGTLFNAQADVGLTYPTGWIRLMVRNYIYQTRMHSSRMRTARNSSRLLGVSASVHGDPPGCGPGNTPGKETPLVRRPPVNRMTDRQV